MKRNSAFGFEAPEESPGFLLWQTTITWQRFIKKALDSYDISHAQFVIMAVLLWFEEHHEDPTQIAISRLSKLDQMMISKSLKKLISQNYIWREESTKDTRAKWVYLTPKGKELVSNLVPIVEGIDTQFFGKLSKSTQHHLVQILGTLMAKIKD